MARAPTAIESWILDKTSPVESDSARALYDRMERQHWAPIPGVEVRQNLREESHFLIEAQVRDIESHLAGASKVLDVGCGDGWPLLRLAPLFQAVVGIDASETRVARCRRNAATISAKNVTVKKMSVTAMEFDDNTFDGAVASQSIEQARDPDQAIREVFRVLKPGSRFRVFFEAYEKEGKGISEGVGLYETDDELCYHYVLSCGQPPWERGYVVRFEPDAGMREEFRQLDALEGGLDRNPELGVELLEKHSGHIVGSSWYQLRHFTSVTLAKALEEAGFVDVRVAYPVSTLAKAVWPRVRETSLTDPQAIALLRGLADLAQQLDAPVDAGQPLVATKPG